MPSKNKIVLFVLFVMLLVAEPLAAADLTESAKRPVVRITTGNWLPYVDIQKADFGPIGRIITAVFERSGYDVTYDVFPWTRDLHVVAMGHYDAIMPAYCTAERAKLFLCSDPIVRGEQVLFHRSDMDFDWSTIDDLKGYRIGATSSYFYGKTFKQAEKSGEITVIRVPKDETNLRLLMRGRIDLYPQDRAVGYGMIRTLFDEKDWPRLTYHPIPLHTNPLGLLFSRATGRGEQLRKVFNAGLENMRSSGELNKMLAPLYADEAAVSGAQ